MPVDKQFLELENLLYQEGLGRDTVSKLFGQIFKIFNMCQGCSKLRKDSKTFCTACKYMDREKLCNHLQCLNLVTGKAHMSCAMARYSPEGECGKRGYLFEQREEK